MPQRKSKSNSGCLGKLVLLIAVAALFGYVVPATTPKQSLDQKRLQFERQKEAKKKQKAELASQKAAERRLKAENERRFEEAQKAQEAREQIQAHWDAQKTHWLNLNADEVRHNANCQFFNNTIQGRYCGPNEGRACRKCGG